LAEGWQELAAAASPEKDTVKLRFLINQLIHALAQEQGRIRDEIDKRLGYASNSQFKDQP
jgi:hypothetical protein